MTNLKLIILNNIMYSVEELKKQVISLDFSKLQEIENLNSEELKKYVISRIETIKMETNEELALITNSKISKIDDYLNTKNPINLSSKKLPVLIPTYHLLNRIKSDLEKY